MNMTRILPGDVSNNAPLPTDTAAAALASSHPWKHRGTVNSHVFRTCWWLIAGYHLTNVVFIFVIGAAQLFISTPTVYDNLWLIQIDRTVMIAAGWSMVAIAVGHLAALMMDIGQSIRLLRLSFGHDTLRQATKKDKKASTRLGLRCFRLLWLPATVFNEYLCETGIFGVYGEYFEVAFYARLAVEIIMQTIQAYQLSRLVQSTLLNRFVVVVIVVNCAFAPVVNRVLHRHPAGRRMALLTFDVILDFIVIAVVPVLVVIPRALDYDWAALKYQDALVFDDVWITNAVGQAKFAMISSWPDFISTVFPHVSCLLALDTVKGMLHRTTPATNEHHGTDTAKAVGDRPLAVDVEKISRRSRLLHRVTMAFYSFAAAWAVFVVICHVSATTKSLSATMEESCKLRLDAWLTSNTTCSVIMVNCHRLEIDGTEDEITSALSFVERATLKRVIFTHCPALSIPVAITDFTHLLCIEIFNSTVIDWRDDAALTVMTTPHVVQLHFLATDFVQFPSALLTDQLPAPLSILVYRGNITNIPDQFGGLWRDHVWPFFTVQYADLSTLPPSFSHIKSRKTSIVGTLLTTLADDALMGSQLETLHLSHNPLIALPQQISDLSKLTQLIAENTSITSLPSWVDDWLAERKAGGKSFVVSFKGSPLCADTTYAEICGDHSILVGYPYELIKTMRPW